MSRIRSAVALLLLVLATANAAAARVGAAPTAAEADTAFAHADWASAAAGYEAVVLAAPGSMRGWARLATACFSLGRYARSAEAWRRAEAAGYAGRVTRYNEACAFARGGQPDSALAALQRLMDTGYGQPSALETDEDLASVRADPRFAAVMERCRHNERPCAYRAESRQFDFWIGDWEVTDNLRGHAAAGESHVELILKDCVIFENWSGRLGGNGKSFNAWNAPRGTWQQNWMDDSGTVTNYVDGRFAGDSLTFRAEPPAPTAPGPLRRLTFFRLGPDRVRQRFDHSADGGKTWVADIDLDYARKR